MFCLEKFNVIYNMKINKQQLIVAYSMEKAGELKKDGKHSVVR
tara:strand:+ start:170 stop:298 length:129 start_codon:yes stop_codon:yes gene_type:complete